MNELTEYLEELSIGTDKVIRGGHFLHEGDVLYLRYGQSLAAGRVAVTLGSIEVDVAHRRQGRFNKYLSTLEAFAKSKGVPVVVENVINPTLSEVLKRKSYRPVFFGKGFLCDTYIKRLSLT